MRQNNDPLWKVLLEDIFDDMLRFVFPDADTVFDMERGFEFLDKELIEINPGQGSTTRFVDKLAKVYTREGTEECILAHVEVQGYTSDRDEFPKRMYHYFSRMFSRYKRPITAIAILTGSDGDSFPDQYVYSCMGTRLMYQYNKFSIKETPEEQLLASDNPFALAVLAARDALLKGKVSEKELIERKLLITKLLLSKKHLSHQKSSAIFRFLKNIAIAYNQELCCIFDQQIDSFTDKSNLMSSNEIYTQYLLEVEKELFVRKLLQEAIFSYEKIATLAGVPLSFVYEVIAAWEEDKKEELEKSGRDA